MKILKFVLFIVLGLFIFNPLSAQTITSYSGVFHKIPKYPSNNTPGMVDKIYGHCKFTVSNPDKISRIELKYDSSSEATKTESFQVSTVDGKTSYEVGGVSRLVKDSGIVLDMDLTDVFIKWDRVNYFYIYIYDRSNTRLSVKSLKPTYKVWE